MKAKKEWLLPFLGLFMFLVFVAFVGSTAAEEGDRLIGFFHILGVEIYISVALFLIFINAFD